MCSSDLSRLVRPLREPLEKEPFMAKMIFVNLPVTDLPRATAFYEAIGYTKLGVMPEYSRRPDGTLWPGAFYFKVLSA